MLSGIACSKETCSSFKKFNEKTRNRTRHKYSASSAARSVDDVPFPVCSVQNTEEQSVNDGFIEHRWVPGVASTRMNMIAQGRFVGIADDF